MTFHHLKLSLPLLVAALCCSGFALAIAPLAIAQEDSVNAVEAVADSIPTEAQVPPVTDADLKRYDQLVIQLRDLMKSNNQAAVRFYLDGVEASYDWGDQWEKSLVGLAVTLNEFRGLACRIYQSDLPQPEGLDKIIDPLTDDMYERGQLQYLPLALEKLLEASPDDEDLKLKLGLAYMKTNRFAKAMSLLQAVPNKLQDLSPAEQSLLRNLPQMEYLFQQEQKIRAQEAAADDLPRVELMTSNGRIVIELFENEAPETVANFISRVESGHYDGTIFHRVIDDFVAQGGGFKPDGQQQPVSYNINDEFKNKNFRRHFHGSISMANTGKPNSGAAEFFINLIGTPFLDGRHTVFGRVIEGESTYQSLTRTHRVSEKEDEHEPIDTALPDSIISAKVLRKRPHEYVPVKR